MAISIQPGAFLTSIDGTWASFPLLVGGESINVVPSTVLPIDYVVISSACELNTNQGLNTNCSASRGGVYTSMNSQTEHSMGQGNYQFEQYLGFNSTYTLVNYYTDTVMLGLEGTGGPAVNNSFFGAFEDPNFWLGYLGLLAVPISVNSQLRQTYFQTLSQQGTISSLSFGYTAGSYNGGSNSSGASLVFGGYDANRLKSNNVTFSMTINSGDSSQYLSPQLSSITADGTTLLDNLIPVTLDPTLPYMWLPSSVCDSMADAFNLSYHNATNMYTVNDTAHQALNQLNPTFTFTFQTSQLQDINITMPYSAFDLTLLNVDSGQTQRYFPLKQANGTNFALGRAFFQYAYIVANFDALTFTISETLPTGPNYKPNIVAISDGANGSSHTNSKSSGSDAGAIAGGVVGGIVGAAIIAFLVWFFVIRKRRYSRQTDNERQDPSIAELHGQDRQRPSEKNRNELEPLGGSGRDTPGVGSPGSEHVPPYTTVNELDTNRHSSARYELDASQPSELPGEREADATDTTTTAAETADKVEETGASNAADTHSGPSS